MRDRGDGRKNQTVRLLEQMAKTVSGLREAAYEQPCRYNSRAKVQNVRGDSSAMNGDGATWYQYAAAPILINLLWQGNLPSALSTDRM